MVKQSITVSELKSILDIAVFIDPNCEISFNERITIHFTRQYVIDNIYLAFILSNGWLITSTSWCY